MDSAQIDITSNVPAPNDDSSNTAGLSSASPAGSLEGASLIKEYIPAPEIRSTAEILGSLENAPKIPQPIAATQEQIPTNISSLADTVTTTSIVDKTQTVNPTHTLKNTKDALTLKADEEEELFLGKVLEHNGPK